MSEATLISDYLGQIAVALQGPRRVRADIIDELHSSLLDALDEHRAAGVPEDQAVHRAIAELGAPSEVAAGFGSELTARQARRLATALVPAAALIVLLWAYAAKTSDPATKGGFWAWFGRPPVPLAVAALLIAALTSSVSVATTGRLTRWFPARSFVAVKVAALGGLSGGIADVAILVLLAVQLAITQTTLAPLPVMVAALASAARVVIFRRAVHSCLGRRAQSITISLVRL